MFKFLLLRVSSVLFHLAELDVLPFPPPALALVRAAITYQLFILSDDIIEELVEIFEERYGL